MRAAVFVLALGACVDHQAPITGTQSLEITLTSPANPGDINNRLPDTARAVSFTITAKGPDGEIDTTFDNQLQVYAHYLGTLTPYLGGTPLATVAMNGGMGTVSLTLPPVFGPTTVWFDDFTDGDSATFATGVSPTLWFRDPFLADIQTPANEMSVDALDAAPLDNKNIDVRASKYGATGKLVVTSVYTQGYTLADVNCAAVDTPPCVAGPYDYMDVFSYSAPLDQDKRFLSEGQQIDGFAGGVTEFDSLTEIGFPQTFVAGDPKVNKAWEPAPVVVDPTWFQMPINFERVEGGLIEVDNAYVCPLDDDYITFKQWKLDLDGLGANCSGNNIINVVTAGTLDLDPATLSGKTLPKLIAVSRPIFKHWIVFPRSMSDITLP